VAFIPLYDGNPLRYIGRPWVAWSLILINTAIFFFFEHGGWEGADRDTVLGFGLIPAAITGVAVRPDEVQALISSCTPFLAVGGNLHQVAHQCWTGAVPEYATLLTYGFLHGDFWHLAGNMIFLWVFADNIEDSLGHFRFLIFYLLCGVAGGVAYILSDTGSYAPVIGASGAIAGIVAAYFMLYPYAKVWILVLGRIPLRLNAILILGFWIIFQVYALIGNDADSQVAWWTHIGGLISGGILVLFMRRKGVKLFARPPPLVAPVPLPALKPAPNVEAGPPPYVDGPWTAR
jgi:membrane associated rhomboid family serine protease